MIHTRNIPSDAAAIALGCSTRDLIHLRRALLIDHVGERVGRGVQYSMVETAEMAVAMWLHRHGLRQGLSFKIAKDSRQQIAAALSADDGKSPLLAVIFDAALEGGCAPVVTNSCDQAPVSAAEAILTVNLTRVVGDALTRLSNATWVNVT